MGSPASPQPLLSVELMERYLTPGNPWRITVFDVLDSTMTEAERLARAGEPEYAVPFAEEQTAGKGRLNRPWHSPARGGIYFTPLFRPRLDPVDGALCTLTTAVAVAEALREFGFPAGIKWPNDILVASGPYARRKICGMRAEASITERGIEWLTMGIGVNINNDQFPPELASVAIALKTLNDGKELEREPIAAAILNHLQADYELLQAEGFEDIRRRWLDLAIGIGEEVQLKGINEHRHGVAVGMDEHGCLLLLEEGCDEPEPALSGDIVFMR